MIRINPQKYSFVTGIYFLISLLIFSIFLLSWSYHSSVKDVDKELLTSFGQRHIICESIIEDQVNFIDIGLEGIISEVSFLDRIIEDDKQGAQNKLLEIVDRDIHSNFDLLFVSLADSMIWADASSSFFDIQSISSAIVKLREIPSSGMIYRFREKSTDITILVNYTPIIHSSSGKTLGRLYGGIVLNNNISLLGKIQNKTNSKSVVFFQNGDIIGSTDRLDAEITQSMDRARQTLKTNETCSGDGIIAAYNTTSLFGHKTSLEIMTAISSRPFRDIKHSYLIKSITMFLFSIIFFLVSMIVIKFFTYPSLKKLLDYSEKITSGNISADYSPGNIIELNQIGLSMENMVESLKAANKEILKEVFEKKQTQDILKQKDLHLKMLTQTIPDLVWLKDADGVYLFCNSRFERFFGAKEKDIIGKTDYDFVDIEMADFFRRHDQLAMKREAPQRNEEEVIYADDGHRELLETVKTPIYGSGNQLIGVLGIARDITERKQVETALKKSEKQFQDLFNSINDLVYTQDLKGHFISVNPAMDKLFGYDMDEFIGQSAASFMGPEDQSGFDSRYLKVVKKQGFHEGTACYFKKNKEKIYIEYSSSLVEPDSGEAYISGIGRDVTGKILSEEKLKKLQGQIVQSQKMESIGTLAGGIAHDFNNILYMIVGNSELALEDTSKHSSVYTNLEQIKSASLRGSDIVKQLLNFSRKTDQQLKPVDAVTIIHDALNFLRSSIPTTIEIREFLPDTELIILADPTQINQVMMNICINASQAMEETGGILEINVKSKILKEEIVNRFSNLSKGKYLNITITDTGPGIASEIIERIFDPYFTTKKLGEGSGLGLSVVHGIINNHNGAILVDSSPGKGTAFKIFFPLVDAQPEDETIPVDGILSGNETLLFVDDEQSIAEMAQKGLERIGYKVKTCLNPEEALELFKSRPATFDLVISDMTMPQMTGAKLAGKLLEIRSDIPVIICSGYSSLIDKEKLNPFGISEYINKPTSISIIAKTIRKILDN